MHAKGKLRVEQVNDRKKKPVEAPIWSWKRTKNSFKLKCRTCVTARIPFCNSLTEKTASKQFVYENVVKIFWIRGIKSEYVWVALEKNQQLCSNAFCNKNIRVYIWIYLLKDVIQKRWNDARIWKNADCSIYAFIFNWVCYAMQWIKIDPSKILMDFFSRFLLYYFPADEVSVVVIYVPST